ncbi:inverse autotransporter beta domain-containing protein, partial [Enterobacter bugandensis]|uniref:inverse autotransporter beta domain-containing protein n=1 Tax=Enterobacter bugandensis TaxID=881260 RepID=UPI0024B51D84
ARWLGQFGTVRAGLSLDSHNSLASSSLDWLVPLYDTPDNTLFTQLGARNRDGRNTLNLGWGFRWMAGGWMYGVNNFFDDDITGNNRRTGIGAEARTDYLQFAANTYLRLNDWHQSRDFDDYDERPANGFDVRAQGWLPAYPQVGGKLMYEQYYGREVALFGKDARQRNPYAVTAGVEWSPFPLLTAGVDERMGKGGKNETSVNLQLTWRPGESLSSQLSPESAGASHLVAAARHDLVERNNNIVLEYRKQELVSLGLSTSAVTGPGGSTQTVAAEVRSKYGLRDVSWDAGALTAAGGSLKALDGTHFAVTLPPYQASPRALAARGEATESGRNVYVLTAVASDVKGNASAPQKVTVTVLPPVLSFDGQLQVTNDNAPADGHSAVTVTAAITDGNHHAPAGQAVSFSITYADGRRVTQKAETDAQGRAAVNVTSTVAGAAGVSATAGSATAA